MAPSFRIYEEQITFHSNTYLHSVGLYAHQSDFYLCKQKGRRVDF